MKKLGYSRFRIMLMALGLGLAVVYMLNGLSLNWWGVPVYLPTVESSEVLEVTVPLEEKPSGPKYLCDEFAELERTACLNQVIYEGRDLSLYSKGGNHGCGRVKQEAEPTECERSLNQARAFIWDHWKKQKRGYVAVARWSGERDSVVHFFVEPKDDGGWRVIERRIPMPVKPDYPYWLGDLIEIKWRHATSEDERFGFKAGSLCLELLNITGDGLCL